LEVRQAEQVDEHDQALVDIFTQLRIRTGHDFANYKRSTVLRRLERRMSVHELRTLPEYAAYIRDHREEGQALLKDLLISVTHFFRDPEAFAALERTVVPRLFEKRRAGDHIRVWVAGCATGEEAYSIAMLLSEYAPDPISGPSLQVFATDIDEAALAKARSGLYTLNDCADISPERLRRFFMKDGDSYRVRRELREMVLFAAHNVIKDPPFSHLDLIACRNLLIYLNRAAQERILRLLHFGLNPGGYLFLGTSETAEDNGMLFMSVDKEHHIFQSRDVESQLTLPAVIPTGLPLVRGFPEERTAETRMRERMSYQELHLRLLEQYAPPSVIINQDYEILHLSEHAGRYLRFVAGEPSQNLLKVVVPDLRLELHSALYQAAQHRTRTEAVSGPVQIDGKSERVKLTVSPVFGEQDASRGLILVLFESSEEKVKKTRRVTEPAQPLEPISRQLEEELVRVKLQLRTTVEQHELQQEELKASNEELQAMNEELRSSSEELETSKEELQSLNEELTTVNQELKIKIDELSQANNDTRNLMNSTDLATVFVDRSMRIKLFTPRARSIFNLIPSDTGRPLLDLTHKLRYKELVSDVEAVLDTLTVAEREVQSSDDHWYITRVLPYRTAEDHIAGVVLTFTDITERKRVEEALRTAGDQLEARVQARTRELNEANQALRREMGEREQTEQGRVRLLRQVVSAQEDERQRISREVHDQLGQEVTALSLKIATLKNAGELSAANREQIENLERMVKQLDNDLDRLVWELRPTGLDDLGLTDALGDYVANWSRQYGVATHVDTSLDARLSPEMETVLYRIVQEALNNVAKHAGARHVQVVLVKNTDHLTLSVADDGAGFDPNAPVAEKGLGLIGIRERAALVGGTAQIHSSPGGGTTVAVRIPI
jgi:two-component system CheB/CheR fusion protein